MYAYQNNILSIPAKLIYEDLSLMAYNTYKSWCSRGKFSRTKDGLGKGNEAWISFYDITEDWVKNAVKAYLGEPKEVIVKNQLDSYIVADRKATLFFSSHRTPNGKPLPFDKQREKATNAMILNAIKTVFKERGGVTKMFGKKKTKIWQNISEAVNALSLEKTSNNTQKWDYSLPSNARSLKRKYDDYLNRGYYVFIHRGEGHSNSRKVTDKIERLILSLYCMPNKPYSSKVHDMYLQFLGGAIEVYDIKSGEVFERQDFYIDGSPVEISEATVWNYINKPANDVLVKKARNGAYDFNHKIRPHVNRTAPNYSMSKITLDDRDIMHTKLHDGNKVMAYYAFDTLSGAMIGISHSKDKNHQLYLDCVRSMFRFTTSQGLGIPMQMEVEHHLVSDFKDGLMKAQNVFPFVRWCNPTNSQEKYAERLIETKKYGVEKDNNQNVGRHYSRLDSNRITRQKIFDEKNDNYKFAKASYEEIVANELQEQIAYNNQPHPNKKRFNGLTRLEVFLQNVNPNLPQYDKALLAKYIGNHVETSIRRNQYVQVQYQKWQLPNPQVIGLLSPNNYKVDAYYIPAEDNTISEVFLYQKGELICECKPAPTFNRANAEWTEADKLGYQEATKYISQFDKMVADNTTTSVFKASIIKNKPTIEIEPEVVELPKPTLAEAFEPEPINLEFDKARAINDL